MSENPTDSADTGMVIRYSLLVISYWLLRTLGRKNRISDVLGYQLVKSGTSVGANYREANRAVSLADFTHKIGIVEKECSESLYWLELCEESDVGD
jgi:four helix bundle protein